MHGVYRAEVGNNHLGRWRNITSHLQRRRGQLAGAVLALHILTSHTLHNMITGSSSHTLCHCHESGRGRGSQTGGVCYQRRCIGGVRGPGRATADGRRSPPRTPLSCAPPSRPRAQPVRAPHPSRPRSPPLIHYLRTADRFQARSFCPPLHDDRSNLMPFLCPASNAIRLRSSSGNQLQRARRCRHSSARYNH